MPGRCFEFIGTARPDLCVDWERTQSARGIGEIWPRRSRTRLALTFPDTSLLTTSSPSRVAQEHSVSNGLCHVCSPLSVFSFTTNMQKDRFSSRPVNSRWALQRSADTATPTHDARASLASLVRASMALTEFTNAFSKTPLPMVPSTKPSTHPLRFLPSRTTTRSMSVMLSDRRVKV